MFPQNYVNKELHSTTEATSSRCVNWPDCLDWSCLRCHRFVGRAPLTVLIVNAGCAHRDSNKNLLGPENNLTNYLWTWYCEIVVNSDLQINLTWNFAGSAIFMQQGSTTGLALGPRQMSRAYKEGRGTHLGLSVSATETTHLRGELRPAKNGCCSIWVGLFMHSFTRYIILYEP